MALTLDFFTTLNYIKTMTIKELEKLIAQNTESAEGGCPIAQGVIVNAEAEIEGLKWEFHFRSWGTEDDREWRSRERNWGVEEEGA